MTRTRPRIGFIGAGRTGTALGLALAEARYPVFAVSSRTMAAAEALAQKIPGCSAYETPQAVADACDLVFLTVPDEAIRPVAKALGWRAGVAVVHVSGVESREALAAAAEQGARTASLHPLQTFADRRPAAPNLRGIVFAVEAEEDLRNELLTVVQDLGGKAIELRGEDRALYHAAAVLTSNYVVTLTKLASDLWLRLGQERPTAVEALLPLLRGAVSNIENLGLPAALTGPIARGDVETMRRHLEALSDAAPELLPVYRELALQTIPVALAKGGLMDSEADELRGLLSYEGSHKQR